MKIETDFYDSPGVEPRALDMAFPNAVTGTPVCLVHGGGWIAGERAAYHEIMQWFVERGHPVASVGYRATAEPVIADQIADVATGYLRFVGVLRDRGLGTPALMGSSAGAHLATVLTQAGPGSWAPGLTSEWTPPSACIPVNGPGTLVPWPGIAPSIKEALDQMCGGTFEDNPGAFLAISPDALVGIDATPPFLVLLAGDEDVFPHSFVYAWAEHLRAVGTQVDVEVIPGAEHGFLYTTSGEPQRRALERVERFLQQTVSAS